MCVQILTDPNKS